MWKYPVRIPDKDQLSRQHNTRIVGSIKGEEFLDQLNDYLFVICTSHVYVTFVIDTSSWSEQRFQLSEPRPITTIWGDGFH
jgi:hypothetical protein